MRRDWVAPLIVMVGLAGMVAMTDAARARARAGTPPPSGHDSGDTGHDTADTGEDTGGGEDTSGGNDTSTGTDSGADDTADTGDTAYVDPGISAAQRAGDVGGFGCVTGPVGGGGLGLALALVAVGRRRR